MCALDDLGTLVEGLERLRAVSGCCDWLRRRVGGNRSFLFALHSSYCYLFHSLTLLTEDVEMARTATIGPEIFERANTLVAEGRTRTEAFAQIGQERGSSPGTVAANYYRVARAQGQGRAKRRAADNGSGDIRQIAQQIADLTQQLVRQVEERDKKIRSLIG
jgi:hypothetical protein